MTCSQGQSAAASETAISSRPRGAPGLLGVLLLRDWEVILMDPEIEPAAHISLCVSLSTLVWRFELRLLKQASNSVSAMHPSLRRRCRGRGGRNNAGQRTSRSDSDGAIVDWRFRGLGPGRRWWSGMEGPDISRRGQKPR